MRRRVASRAKKGFALQMALILLFQCGFPSVSWALTSGPSQPEVQSFEPIGTSDMVDLFSGDFTYNIPLLDVEGYPINLSYHSGISMDQEASWCGLGWNINPGVINRNMRGIPDDFSGDIVSKEFNMKKNMTVGVSTGLSGELFGLDFASFNARLGIKYNNYNGVGMERSFNVSVSASNKYGGTGSASLGIASSSDDGLSLQPSLSLSQKMKKDDQRSSSVGMSVGASFNSRGGLTKLTVSTNLSSNTTSKMGKHENQSSTELVGMSSSFDFGGQTFSPSVDFPMENLSITGNFTLGGEVFGFDGSVAFSGYYAEQGLSQHSMSNPAYGYMNAQNGQGNDNAMMDFNREKDGSFNNSTFNLPLTNFTYDIYSVSGQGTGGSYRPFRSDIGYVFDASASSTSYGGEIGVEVGLGDLTHVGVNVVANTANTTSGKWSSASSTGLLNYRGSASYPDYEPYYFKEANEKSVDPDAAFFDNYGGNSAAKIDIDGSNKFNANTTGNLQLTNGTIKALPSNNYRNARERRSSTISTLSNKEVNNNMGLDAMLNSYIGSNIGALGHHIGQISSIGDDGKRYVYGLPAYNMTQEETTFATGIPEGGGSARAYDPATGYVTYVPGSDNSTGNSMGLDNYYNNIKMPAFAHSYLLTAVLSPDYVDMDNVKGPSDGDIGSYVKFTYTKIDNFKWRTPVGANQAKGNLGLLSNDNDDKANYVYGEKQLFYVSQIETKNYKAVFETSDRADALGVTDKNGAINTSVKQKKLDKIILYSKAANTVIKTIHFKYDYDLCGNTSVRIPNNSASISDPESLSNHGGKLTLSKLYFTYQNSDKGAFNAYDFTYSSFNPPYDMMKYDRWGNFKRNNPNSIGLDWYPYTNQNVPQDTANKWSAAWHLTNIGLPSGGSIEVDYESDDYAYVQNRQAMQMYVINSGAGATDISTKYTYSVTVPAGHTIDELLPDAQVAYFRFKMDLNGGKYDYVPGYAEIDRPNCSVGTATALVNGVVSNTATIAFKPVTINDNSGGNVNPIVKAAIQFGRLNNSRLVWDQPNASDGISEQVFKALINSGFFQNIEQTIQGPNKYLLDQGRCTNSLLAESWIKLKNVTGFKYGGGNRVKRVIMDDNFNSMDGSVADSYYGQEYDYSLTTPSGKVISSGVAAYEPQLGGEENSLKDPFFTETKHLLAPDDEHYVEAPFGESFYPSPTVGYSQVKVKNYIPTALLPTGATVSRHGTGYVMHEFYTAKDFPTITDRTDLEAIEHKNDPFSLASLFHIESKDYMTAAQGFYVELNDMHGKPRSEKVFAEGQTMPISSVEYKYKSTPYGNGSSRLDNMATVLYSDGTVKQENIGLFFDAVGDFREETAESRSYGINLNIDGFLIVAIPVYVPVPLPSYTSDKTRADFVMFTKVVQRFGILDETTANKDGSVVSTKNLAYDAETGRVLLTQVNNDFDDPTYAFKYPAYWYYTPMGPAYKNINYSLPNITFSGTGVATIPASNNKFIEGDEVELSYGSSVAPVYAWVTAVTPTSITVEKKNGTTVNGTFSSIKVVRSGNRNMQSVDMANITTMVNPLNGIKTNIYDRVIQASSVEFGNRWRMYCNCNSTAGTLDNTNPYANGTKGSWRPVRSYLHLTGRTQENYDNNTNLRTDGMFTSYSPYYKLNTNGKWSVDAQNWTYTSEVTEFNTFGQELENVDALGRYSAATYGFNQTMATSVGANTKLKELGFDSFEDYGLASCADKHFKFSGTVPTTTVTSHTGQYSVKVLATHTLSLGKQIGAACDRAKTCPGTIIYSPNNRYEIQGGTGPYNIDVDVISGSGSIQASPDGMGFTVANPQNGFTARVTIIDDNGCTYVKLIQSPYTN